jgi:hypothetical protein
VRLKDWTTRAFSILDNVEINDSRIVTGQGGLFPSRIVWNEIVFQSFQAGFLRNIDFQLCMRLEHPTALRMYRYLGKQFYAKPDLTFDLKAFAEANLGLGRGYEGGTQIARKLKPAIKELEAIGFLEPLTEDERFLKKGREWSVRFIQKAPAQATVPASLPVAAPETVNIQPSPILAELTKRGVKESTAAEMVQKYPAPYLEGKIEEFDWEMTQPKPPKRPAGYLVTSIRDGYDADPDFVSRAERERQAEATRLAKEKDAENSRRKRQQKADEEALQAEVEAHIKRLSPVERMAAEAEAMANASPEARENLENPIMARYRDTLMLGLLREHVTRMLANREAADA